MEGGGGTTLIYSVVGWVWRTHHAIPPVPPLLCTATLFLVLTEKYFETLCLPSSMEERMGGTIFSDPRCVCTAASKVDTHHLVNLHSILSQKCRPQEACPVSPVLGANSFLSPVALFLLPAAPFHPFPPLSGNWMDS